MKIKQVQKVLKSNLMLLVMLRESLAAEGAEKTPLYVAVAAQAQLTGQALPGSMRLTPEQVKMFRHAAQSAKGGAAGSKPQLPGPGQMVILTPEQMGGNKAIIVKQ